MEQSKNANSLQSEGSKTSNGFLHRKSALIDKASDILSKNEEHKEGRATKVIENQTSKIPSVVYLALAVASMAVSAAFATSTKRKDLANFVGLWAPSFLLLGLYNKMVKIHGSDNPISNSL